MNHINQWLRDLTLLPDVAVDRWQPFLHRHESLTCTASELPETLQTLGELDGWLTETGRVVRLRNTRIELQNLPLAGEFFRDEQCWQLTQLPRGRWQLNRHHLQACPADEANCLGENVEHLLAGSGDGRLRYWRLWEPDEDNAPHCRIALLTAIEEFRA
ncbi:hypothetical protein [Azotobacter vinelandii]|uniref:hypothetical protein n=1 Tax=Azotobacter vinelandii TaxID=354 RepID=UPI002664EB94|nr:hypothetical protein [Azotobacter vinelandii]WKN24019.1 hypothetical protein AVAEIV_002157 [Azotobacter vinelandii]